MDELTVLRNPFFWATCSLFALTAGNAIVANVLPRNRVLGLSVVAGVMGSRLVLALPYCPQPRFDLAGTHLPVGLALMFAAAALLIPVLRVEWTTGPDESESLRTTGAFSLVRHPGYLGNVLLCLGWAVAFRSTIGVGLTAIWFLGFLLHAMIEEASLERTYGAAYDAYKNQVPARLLPAPWARSKQAGL